MSRALGAVARAELARTFRRPLAFAVLAGVQAFLAVAFMLLLIAWLDREPAAGGAGVTQAILVPYFHVAAILSLLLLPILTMGTLSSERRDGRLRFLFSVPVSSFDLVAGKLAAALGLAGALWFAAGLIPLTLFWGAPVDGGVYATNLLGLALFMVLHVCLGVMISAATRQPVLAGTAALLTSLALWFADWANRLDAESSALGTISTLARLRGFALGVLNMADVVYFLAVSLAFAALAVWLVEGERRHA